MICLEEFPIEISVQIVELQLLRLNRFEEESGEFLLSVGVLAFLDHHISVKDFFVRIVFGVHPQIVVFFHLKFVFKLFQTTRSEIVSNESFLFEDFDS